MKNISRIALFAIAALIMGAGARAQNHTVHATIPFDFALGGNLFPPGSYSITTEASSQLILLQNNKTHLAGMTVSQHDLNGSRKDCLLVFNRYGNRYFLKGIRCAGASMNLKLFTSKAEQRARTQEASLGGKVHTIAALRY
ncbi:MAG: hypothetical protein WA708_03855 [Acidobacteriaceae bacterium]